MTVSDLCLVRSQTALSGLRDEDAKLFVRFSAILFKH